MKSKTATFITLSSLAGAALFVIYAFTVFREALISELSAEGVLYELLALLFMAPLLIPSVLGFRYFRKRPGHWTKTVFTYFLLYLIAVVLASILLFWPGIDPYTIFIVMVGLILPACVILTVLMVVRLSSAEPHVTH